MFTHECFIRRTDEEIIKRLEDIGHYWFSTPYDRYDAIAVIDVFYNKGERAKLDKPYLQLRLDVTETYLKGRAIDCGDDIDLFIAVASLRGDSDINQLITDGVKWVKSEVHDIKEIKGYFLAMGFDWNETHKASVGELIDYFKNKK